MHTHTSQHIGSNLARWSLIVGIVIVLNMFFNYALSLVYPEPKYENWFPVQQVTEPITTKESCLSVGGQWTGTDKIRAVETNEKVPDGYCDPDFTKREAYNDARDLYNRNVFIILSVLGIIALILGVLLAHATLGAALAWGGVLSLVIASARYWSASDTIVKVVILGVALGALIWVAIKKFGK